MEDITRCIRCQALGRPIDDAYCSENCKSEVAKWIGYKLKDCIVCERKIIRNIKEIDICSNPRCYSAIKEIIVKTDRKCYYCGEKTPEDRYVFCQEKCSDKYAYCFEFIY